MLGKSMTRTVGVLGMMSAASLVASAGGVNWLNPVDGVWSLGTNWDAGVVPTNPDVVSLGLVGAYRVSLTGGRSAGILSVVNPDVELAIENAASLTVFGNLFNGGLIHVNPFGFGSTTTLSFGADALLSGSGEVQLGAVDSRARIATNPGVTLTHGSDHLIHGIGRIEALMVNDGTIRSQTGEIRLTILEKTNNGLIEAIGPGVIEVSGTTVTQGAGGLIIAQGLGGQIELRGATIVGGDLRGIVGSDVSVDTNSTLDGVVFTGDMELQNAQVLTIRNSFENNGTIDVNPFGFGSTTSMFFEDTMTLEGDGEIELSAPASRARIQTGVGAVLTVNPSMTVRGEGRIEADYVNYGLLSSNEGATIEMTVNPKTNHSVMEAIGGSTLNIQGVTVTQSKGGVIRALGSGSQVVLNGAEIIGGELMSAGLGEVVVSNSSVIDEVIHEGTLNVSNAQTLTLRTLFRNDGFVYVNPLGFGSTTTLHVPESMAISGDGTIVLGAPNSRARIQTAEGATLELGADQTVRGEGRFEAMLNNEGLIRSDVGGEIEFIANQVHNESTIEAVGGSSVRFAGIPVVQGLSGEIRADGDGSVVEFSGASVGGGTLVTTGTSRFEMSSSSAIEAVNCMATIHVSNAHTLRVFHMVLNNGLIEVNPIGGGATTTLEFNESMVLDGNGVVRLRANASRSRLTGVSEDTFVVFGTGQRLEGVGRIEVDLVSTGVIGPGIDGVGTMTALNPIEFGAEGAFEVEINGGGSDRIECDDEIVLGGTLEVSYIEGFAPLGYWARTILEGSEITGGFSAVSIPAPAMGLVTKVVNTGTEVIVGQTCKSDQNLDGVLDFFDISSFLTAYGAMDPAADFNNDGQFDFFDVSAFLVAFSEGCGF
ncbi:MAG: GC-type dockerin domain-anchored protein [Phycisphaerales bacterium]